MMGSENKSGGQRTKVRIVIADEQPFMRAGLKHFLDQQPDLVVCGEADTVGVALERVETCMPELLLVDMRMKQGDVLELLKALRSRFPLLRILIHTLHDEMFYAERALRAGAHGYLMKGGTPQELLTALGKVMSGEIYLSRPMASALLSRLLQAPAGPAGPRPIEGLSDREFQVFHMLAAGLGNRQIAAQLSLSVKTIETYRENIKHKFGFKTSAELLRHATHWLQTGGATAMRSKFQGAGQAQIPAFLAATHVPSAAYATSLGKTPL
jgi:DNA-binding NarL/FixJ family response regulator